MSVLPQLERELLDAHARRRRGRAFARPRWDRATPLLIGGAVTAIVVVLVFGLLARTHGPARPRVTGGPHALLRGVQVDGAYAAGGRVYATSGALLIRIVPGGHSVQRSFGRFHGLPSWVDAMRLAFGRLWITTGDAAGYTRLWQLDPDSLRPLHQPILLAGMGTGDFVGQMSSRGVLWVTNGDTIDIVSPASSGVVASHPVAVLGAAATGVDVAASSSFTDLYVSGAVRHAFIGRVGQGPRLLWSHVSLLPEPYAPAIVATWGRGVWVLRFDGRRVTLMRFDSRSPGTLRPSSAARKVVATKGLGAQLAAGILWVTDPRGGQALNYCADPSTGRARAPLSLPAGAWLLTADANFVYYSSGSGRSSGFDRMPIDPRCR